MLESKKGSFSISIEHTTAVGDAACCISFKSNASSCCLNKLRGKCSCDCFPEGAEEAYCCYAIYLVVNEKLCGNTLAVNKSKVGKVDCNMHDKTFSICWNVKGTGSAVRKSIGIVLKALTPGKVYSTYTLLMRSSNHTPNRETFNYVANELNKSIKSDVMCVVVGKCKVDKDGINKMIEVLTKKIDTGIIDGTKQEPKDHVVCDHSDMTEIKITGWESFFAYDFLTTRLRGTPITLGNKVIYVGMKPATFTNKIPALKKAVGDFADKISSVKDVEIITAYLMISSSGGCAGAVHSLLKAKLSSSIISKAIHQVV